MASSSDDESSGEETESTVHAAGPPARKKRKKKTYKCKFKKDWVKKWPFISAVSQEVYSFRCTQISVVQLIREREMSHGIFHGKVTSEMWRPYPPKRK